MNGRHHDGQAGQRAGQLNRGAREAAVGAGLLTAAGAAALLGSRQQRKAAPAFPERTVDSVKADDEETRERAHR